MASELYFNDTERQFPFTIKKTATLLTKKALEFVGQYNV